MNDQAKAVLVTVLNVPYVMAGCTHPRAAVKPAFLGRYKRLSKQWCRAVVRVLPPRMDSSTANSTVLGCASASYITPWSTVVAMFALYILALLWLFKRILLIFIIPTLLNQNLTGIIDFVQVCWHLCWQLSADNMRAALTSAKLLHPRLRAAWLASLIEESLEIKIKKIIRDRMRHIALTISSTVASAMQYSRTTRCCGDIYST